jgi:ribosomal protein S10
MGRFAKHSNSKYLSTHIFNMVVVDSLSWETFEQIVFWRLLQAETGGSVERIELLMDAISNENILELSGW